MSVGSLCTMQHAFYFSRSLADEVLHCLEGQICDCCPITAWRSQGVGGTKCILVELNFLLSPIPSMIDNSSVLIDDRNITNIGSSWQSNFHKFWGCFVLCRDDFLTWNREVTQISALRSVWFSIFIIFSKD